MKDTTKKDLVWFGNDADGLSVIDILAFGMFIFFLIMKILHFIISIIVIRDTPLILQLNIIMDDINYNMYVILLSYFGKKSVDSIITKIGLFKSGKYNEYLTQLNKSIEEVVSTPVEYNEEKST